MSFTTVRDNIISFLGTQSQGEFTVIGYKPQEKDAVDIVSNKQITVVARNGDFPKDTNSVNRKLTHICTFELILTVASNIAVDLATIENGASTELQIATAIANRSRADDLANKLWDAFFITITKIIMSPQNRFLGNTKYTISDRWLNGFEKGEPMNEGESVVIAGRCFLTLSCEEDLTHIGLTQTLDVIHGTINTVSNDETEIDTYTKTEVEETY